ncbi:TKL protein kinase [Saprolegnia parasitica CBS 223.65]|uniref:TKL protein kinase n=1 Tax=Saprolegnia parasitica (strain CBS 223.65) TaxID=695850 RepID=A0A067C4I0_SAPPC|nr:TKL protein kinase [Saprolegnia parasitica CBS 223.65]KDO21677.1 TKL protein kinase [Saprolegnia parasitica CBS 223.65]|eukprot:XP_012207600.1 TKL protein kinase [Saprolegnia parasitica CBS 223.65]
MDVDVWTMQPEQDDKTLLAVAIQRGHNAVAQVLYPRMYPTPALILATDLRVRAAIFGTPNVTVYTASYHGKDVVLKGPKFPNKRIMTEFQGEVAAMRTAKSPYLMPLIGFLDNQSAAPHTFKPRGQLYSPTMVMEYMDLGDLHAYIQAKKHKVPVELDLSTIDVALVLALALVDLHARGLIHRDVKSLNIFLSTTHYVRLGDLGSARTLDTDSVMSSNTGTKYWMAPEVLRVPGHGGEGRPYTTAADIYSFGVVLTELDTLSEPYSHVPVEKRGAIEENVRLGKLRPKMSATCLPWLPDLANKCLAFNPRARPTAAAIVDELLLQRKTKGNASASAGGLPP